MGLFNIRNKANEERSFNMSLSKMFQTTNIYISEDVVSKIPIISESINLICGSIAQMPIYLYKEENLKINRKYSDYREFILNQESNDFEASFDFKYKLVQDLLYYGKSYHYIEKQGLKIKALHRVDPRTVTIKEFVNDKGIIVDKEIHYTLNNKALITNICDFMIIEKGKGILNSSDLLQLFIVHDDTVKYAFQNAALPVGILQTSGRLTENAVQRLRQSWSSLYSGSRNAGKTIILEEGLEYKSLHVNMEQLQMIEHKEQLISEIKRLFNLYDIKSDDEFLKRTLSPLITCIENSIDKNLLLEKEKEENFFFRFDTRELLRPSTKEQYEVVALAVQKGLMTINEARQYLDLPIFFNPEHDKLILSLGNCLADKDLNVDVLNLGLSINAENNTINSYKTDKDILDNTENKGNDNT